MKQPTDQYKHFNHYHELTDQHELVDFGDGEFIANIAAIPLLKALNELGLRTRTHHVDEDGGFFSILLDSHVLFRFQHINEMDRRTYDGMKELLIEWHHPKEEQEEETTHMATYFTITQEQHRAIQSLQSVGPRNFILKTFAQEAFTKESLICLNSIPFENMARILYEPDSYTIAEEDYVAGDHIKYWTGTDYRYGKFDQREDDKIYAYWGDSTIPTYVHSKKIERMTLEEIKIEQERSMWRRLGREVGVFKDGDVGKERTGFFYTDLELLKKLYADGLLVSLYPAGSSIQFGGAEK